MRITFDVDGVLNDITGYILDKYGVTEELVYYDINKNEHISEYARKGILLGYSLLENFEKAGFLDDALRLAELPLDNVYIHTLSCNDYIAEYKRKYLMDTIGVPYGNIYLGDYYSEQKMVSTDILVEDSIENIVNANTSIKNIIIDKSYNKAETYGYTDRQLNIERVASLSDAVDYIIKVKGSYEV